MTDSTDPHAFARMLEYLQSLFAKEGRPGGDEAAAALSEVLAAGFTLGAPDTINVAAQCEQALRLNPHHGADAVIAALPLINWHHSGLDDGRFRPQIALHMATTELIGPHGMVFHPTVRAGLFFQSAGVDYVTRTHSAEETFVILGGSGYWSCDGAPPQARTAGDYIHHRSNAPHVSITRDEPFIAAWRWTGDIAFQTYALSV